MSDGSRRFGPLNDDRWQMLDRLLADVLSREPGERPPRLRELARRHPELADDLETLVSNAADEHRLDDILAHTLAYLAGYDSAPSQRRLGPWRLLSLIGHGGMAQVFLAERADGAYQQQVAVKLIWPGLASATELERFHRERQLLAAMDDHRIARLLDGGVTDDGRPWLAMEYVRGETIDRHCRKHRLRQAEVLGLFLEVAGAVAHAHRRLAVHGDLKPGNILVSDDGRVKLLDFGIGRLVDTKTGDEGRPALTPRYASPEQRRQENITTASDVYQLGCLLLELLTGLSPPDSGNNPVVHDVRGRLSGDIAAVLQRAMAADPEERYASVDALADDVQRFLQHQPVQARGSGWFYRARCLVRRHRVAVTAGGLAGAALIVAGGLYLQQTWRVAEEAQVNRAALTFLEDMLHTGDPYAGREQSLMPVEVLEDAAARAAGELSGQPRVQARVFNVLGRIHRSRGEAGRAMEHLETARTIAQAHELHEELGRSLVGMAMVGIWSGDYHSAQETLESVLREREADAGLAGDRLTDRIRLFLADLLHSRGYYRQAESLVLDSLDTGHHPAWAHRMLGMILRDAGRFAEAEQHLRAAIALDRDRLGNGHADVAIGLEHYGQLLLHTGRVEAACDSLDEAHGIRLDLVGPGWDGLIWTRHWLGLCALARGDPERARDLLETTVGHYLQSFSESSHLLAFARSDLGWVALARGDWQAAARLFHDAVDGLSAVQPGDHPRIAEPLLGLAATAMVEGDLLTARGHATRALSIRRREFATISPDHPWISSACDIVRSLGGACPERNETVNPQALDRIKADLAIRPDSGDRASGR